MLQQVANPPVNQMQNMPTGDADDDVPRSHSPMRKLGLSPQRSAGDIPNELQLNQSQLNATQSASLFNRSTINGDKHTMLYDDAKHRQMRQEHIYSKCIDRECTFKPALITKKSRLSQNTVKEVQEVVRGNLTGQNNHELLSVDISAIQNNSILRNNLDLSLNSQTLPKNKSRMQYLNKSGFRDNE